MPTGIEWTEASPAPKALVSFRRHAVIGVAALGLSALVAVQILAPAWLGEAARSNAAATREAVLEAAKSECVRGRLATFIRAELVISNRDLQASIAACTRADAAFAMGLSRSAHALSRGAGA